MLRHDRLDAAAGQPAVPWPVEPDPRLILAEQTDGLRWAAARERGDGLEPTRQHLDEALGFYATFFGWVGRGAFSLAPSS